MIGVASLVTGCPGAGKTLGWVKWLADDFLCRPGQNVITNIRLNIEPLAEYVYNRCNTFLNRHWGYSPDMDEIMGRITLLNDEDCNRLRNTQDIKGFFGELENTYICLDEFHTFCPVGSSGLKLQSWANFVAVLRHHYSSICAISQDVSQIDRVYKARVESRTEFLSADSQFDPYFKIPIGDWSSLISALSGCTIRPNVRAIYRKGINGRWVVERIKWDFIDSRFFGFYDSWQKGDSLQ